MNSLEQNLLFAATLFVLAGTLVVFVVQYVRQYRKKKRDDHDA